MPRLAPPALCVGLFLLVPAAAAWASNFVEPQSWTRGGENATYQEWDAFSVQPGQDNPSSAGAHPPDVGVKSVEGGQPTLEELSGFSFITSSRNIYSFADALNVRVSVPNFDLGDDYFTTIVLQTKTQGAGIDPASVLLGDLAPDATTTLAVEEIESPGGTALVVESWFRWMLPADLGNAASYALTFKALGSSMSLDRVAVDTWTGTSAKLEPVPGLANLPGDANGDGAVDLADFGVLKANFGTGTTVGQGDFSGDGAVDLTDFGILKENFGASAAAVVPEPSTLLLGLVGIALWAGTGRGRRG